MNTELLKESFILLGQGMGGIFVVMIIIALIVALLKKTENGFKR